jgi:hypothetical protein
MYIEILKKNYKLIFCVAIYFGICGLISTYLYIAFFDYGGFLFPGLLFTIFSFGFLYHRKIKVSSKRWLLFLLWMLLAYTVTWSITLWSSWIAILVGIFTVGWGAWSVFYIIHKFIIPFDFDTVTIRFFGGLSFLIGTAISFILPKESLEEMFSIDKDGFSIALAYVEVIPIWQITIGCILALYLNRQKQ